MLFIIGIISHVATKLNTIPSPLNLQSGLVMDSDSCQNLKFESHRRDQGAAYVQYLLFAFCSAPLLEKGRRFLIRFCIFFWRRISATFN